jgi:hypothetical protein
MRVVGAGELPQEAHHAPLHLFRAAPQLVEFGRSAYQRRSEQTSRLLGELFERLRGEGFDMSFTMEDFNRQYIKEHFPQLTPEEREEVVRSLPPEERLVGLPPEQRLAGLSAEQIRQYLDQLTAGRRASRGGRSEQPSVLRVRRSGKRRIGAELLTPWSACRRSVLPRPAPGRSTSLPLPENGLRRGGADRCLCRGPVRQGRRQGLVTSRCSNWPEESALAPWRVAVRVETLVRR